MPADLAQLRAQVEELSFPRNRFDRQQAADRCENLLADRLTARGWRVERQAVASGCNLIARRGNPKLLIGAHYDTLTQTPGADDNTASVVALLELADRVGEHVELVAFDYEEVGLLGSYAYVREHPHPPPTVILETVAYSDPRPNTQKLPPGFGFLYPQQYARMWRQQFAGDFSLVLYRKSSRGLAESYGQCLAAASGAEHVVLLQDPRELPIVGRHLGELGRQFGRSDHQPFWEAGLPAVMVTDTANFRNPHYHQPSDLPHTLDYRRLAEVIEATALLATAYA